MRLGPLTIWIIILVLGALFYFTPLPQESANPGLQQRLSLTAMIIGAILMLLGFVIPDEIEVLEIEEHESRGRKRAATSVAGRRINWHSSGDDPEGDRGDGHDGDADRHEPGEDVRSDSEIPDVEDNEADRLQR